MVIEWPEKIISVVEEYWLIEINYAKGPGRIITIYDSYDFKKS